ncbi:MAG: 4Fe-4S binding protein [Firmicutes bacterium]|nr:4Fe-4S binding protein [Bacillota bacterium]
MEFKAIVHEHEKGTHMLFPQLCKGCGLCIAKCPVEALSWSDVLGVYGTPAVVSNEKCTACGICQTVCPDCAIRVDKKKKAS